MAAYLDEHGMPGAMHRGRATVCDRPTEDAEAIHILIVTVDAGVRLAGMSDVAAVAHCLQIRICTADKHRKISLRAWYFVVIDGDPAAVCVAIHITGWCGRRRRLLAGLYGDQQLTIAINILAFQRAVRIIRDGLAQDVIDHLACRAVRRSLHALAGAVRQ